MNSLHLFPGPWKLAALLTLAFSTLLAQVAQAQSQFGIVDFDFEATDTTNSRLKFFDPGTDATGYEVQFSPTLEPGSWTIPDAQFLDLGDGMWQADVSGLPPDRGFLRVKLIGLDDAIHAYLDPVELTDATEGSPLTVTVHFSQPYRGPLNFRWGGTADIENPTGVIHVNGTTAQIVVNLLDNATVDELTYLTLALETTGETGYVLDDETAGTSAAIIFVEDNDSLWQGGFQANDVEMDLRLELISQGGTITASLLGDPFSILPDNDSAGYPATSTTADGTAFHARFTGVPIPESDENGLPSGATLDLELTGSLVTETLISGPATLLIARDPAHLNTTLAGTFTLTRRPASQSTAEVALTQ